MKKIILSDGWIEVTSKTYPDRTYYFNTKTGVKTWNKPQLNSHNQKQNAQKRKNEGDDGNPPRPLTPPLAPPNISPRKKLKAKRSLPAAAPNKTSIETAEMKKYREKIQQRLSKSLPSTTTKNKSSISPTKPTVKAGISQTVASAKKSSPKTTVDDLPKVKTDFPIPGRRRISRVLPIVKPPTENGNVDGKRESVLRLKRNIANERLDKLRKQLDKERQEEENEAKNKKATAETKEKNSLPSSYQNSKKRLKVIDMKYNTVTSKESQKKASDILLESLAAPKQKQKVVESEVTPQTIVDDINSNSFYEEMDWEPIEVEKITFEVQGVRNLVAAEFDVNKDHSLPQNNLNVSSKDTSKVYIVIDTNVFLSNLGIVKEARDILFQKFERPILVVPWTVIRELDYIKDNKSNAKSEVLMAKARRAIRFLNEHFASKHPRVLGQTIREVQENRNLFAAECVDDEILQACLQIHAKGNFVVLLSYDKNLCNKAMIHGILTIGAEDSLEKIDTFDEEASKPQIFAELGMGEAENNNEKDGDATSPEEDKLVLIEEAIEEVKAIVKAFLAEIVTKELQNLYGAEWKKYVIIKPPWSAMDVFKCAAKYWNIQDAFHRKAERIFKELYDIVKNETSFSRTLNYTEYALRLCKELIYAIKSDDYSNIVKESSESIKKLILRFQNERKKLESKKLSSLGKPADLEEKVRRGTKAFQYFQKVYEYARDICGLACQQKGLQCNFCFEIPAIRPECERLEEIQTDNTEKLTQLRQLLATALENPNENLAPEMLTAFCHVLKNFLPEKLNEDLPQDLSPLDILCCFETKRGSLETGLLQIDDICLCSYRLANV